MRSKTNSRRSGVAAGATLGALTALAGFALACAPASPSTPTVVRPGLEVLLSDPPPILAGKRVGLITNHTGVDQTGTSAIDLLADHPSFQLVALYAPEHGIRGVAEAGEHVASGRDARTGLPIHSLYGETRKPTPGMLEGVEALIFDIQDVGARQYTYPSTMALAMEAAREKGIPIVVLDRVNPVGGAIVEGGVLDTAFASFVGMFPVPSRHGMTVGELARYFNASIGADLTVVTVEGWRREQWFDETGLAWVNPSPNIRRLEAAIHYPGTVYLEGTNLSEGRGTDAPFEQTGAPWLRAAAVVARLDVPGVRFDTVSFTVDPAAGKYPGMTLPGIRMVVTDREVYRPIEATLRLIDAIRREHPAEFEWTGSMDRLAGTDQLRAAIEAGELDALLARWSAEAAAFAAARGPYLLYP